MQAAIEHKLAVLEPLQSLLRAQLPMAKLDRESAVRSGEFPPQLAPAGNYMWGCQLSVPQFCKLLWLGTRKPLPPFLGLTFFFLPGHQV